MNEIAMWIGYVFMTVVAVTALLWLWEVTIRKAGNRMLESKQFYDVLIRYAKEKKLNRWAGRDE